jgi:hypothetical protein
MLYVVECWIRHVLGIGSVNDDKLVVRFMVAGRLRERLLENSN